MTVNYSWWWGYSFADLESMLLLPVPLCPRVVIPIKVLFMGQIDLFENY